jgi:hypothetical protein
MLEFWTTVICLPMLYLYYNRLHWSVSVKKIKNENALEYWITLLLSEKGRSRSLYLIDYLLEIIKDFSETMFSCVRFVHESIGIITKKCSNLVS